MKKRRRPGGAVVTGGKAEAVTDAEEEVHDEIRKQLRIVQNISGCSTSVLNLVLARLQPYLKGCGNKRVKMCRVRSRKHTAVKRQLHGCVGCHEHVFSPESKMRACPKCEHPRFDTKGNAHEVSVFEYCSS